MWLEKREGSFGSRSGLLIEGRRYGTDLQNARKKEFKTEAVKNAAKD